MCPKPHAEPLPEPVWARGGQVEQKAAVGAIGEDLFSIALDQPFRFPASFTFVLRAFATLEGLGRALSPGYKFAAVAQPYALQLLRLQVRPACMGSDNGPATSDWLSCRSSLSCM